MVRADKMVGIGPLQISPSLLLACLLAAIALCAAILATPLPTPAQSLDQNCDLIFRRPSLRLKNSNTLVCRVDMASQRSVLGLLNRRGRFTLIRTYSSLKRHLRTTGNASRRSYRRNKQLCDRTFENQARTNSPNAFLNGMSCLTQPSPTPTEQPAPIATQDPTPTSTATATPSSTPTTVPTATSTVSPTPTVTPTATNSFPSRVQTSALTHDFGAIGISEIRYFNFILKPDQGVPAVTGVQLHSSNGISVLSPSSMTARGVVPCNGTMDRYCGITVRAEGITLGAKEASFSVNLVDESDPNIVETVGPFNVRATVQSSPVISDSQFRTVSFKQKAQQAGLTPVQYLINQYNRAKPTSFRVDTTNIHSSAVSDALIFDQYGSPSTAINWRNNWLNTLFDFSASAWDTYGGAAPDYLGPYSQGGAAITRCHIATAKHYPRGGGFTFHRRSGEAAWFNIVGQADTPTYDIRIYRIDPCLPPEYPIYPLLDPSDLEGGTSLVGAPYFGNHFNVSDFIRRGSILQIGFHSTTHIGGTATSLAPSSMQVTAQVGDSGSPTFIYFDGELVLMSTYTNGGWGSGPFYGSAAVQQELRNALETLANQ